jgi:putative addiction module component (TIGR02574 family)
MLCIQDVKAGLLVCVHLFLLERCTPGLGCAGEDARFDALLLHRWLFLPRSGFVQPLHRAAATNASASYTPGMSNSAPDYRWLSVSERIQLVEDIWDSIVAENPESVQLTSLQRAELNRRLDAHDSDPSSAVAWDEVRSELFQRNH